MSDNARLNRRPVTVMNGHAMCHVALATLLLLGVLGFGRASLAQQWIEHRPAGAGYRVEFPGSPQVETRNTRGRRVHIARIESGQIAYVAMRSVYRPGTIPVDPEVTFDLVRDDGVRTAQGKLREEQRVRVSGAPARRLIIDGPNNLVAVQLMVQKDRSLYQAIHVGPADSETSADAERFLSSLALTDR